MAGGFRIHEPAADLAVAAALASSIFDMALPHDAVVFGEISLSSDVRAVNRSEERMKEAAKLGFGRAISATPKGKSGDSLSQILPITAIRTLPDLISRVETAANGSGGPDSYEESAWAA